MVNSSKRGFTILFSVVFAALLLSVGISIFNLAIKELRLSSSGRESQFAFYAADTAMECTLFYDGMGAFKIASTTYTPTYRGSSSPSCDSYVLTQDPDTSLDMQKWTEYDSASGEICFNNSCHTGLLKKTTFSFKMNNLPYCAHVYVYKADESPTDLGYTKIDVRGYNTCEIDSPGRVERGVTAVYTTI